MTRDVLIRLALAAVSVAIITWFFWCLCALDDSPRADAVEVIL